MAGGRTLLVSTYESGHQPLGLAAPAAALRAAGHDVRCVDASVEALDASHLHDAALVAISVPMHTAARLAVEVARQVRRHSPTAHIAFYGLYAAPLRDLLIGQGLADSVVGGEYEPGLVRLAGRLADGVADAGLPTGTAPGLHFDRQRYPVPDRRGLPPLDRYARLSVGGELRLAGHVEASRGCAHTCAHCPITPVYRGRLRLVQRDTVVADVGQQVAMGAHHITFGDPDFLNAPSHSLAVVEEVHRRHPGLTFDATIKVEHLVEHQALLPRLRGLGCLFITSAFESANDAILRRLEKGHTRADMDRVLAFAARERLVIRPTWVAFTPWTTIDDYLALLAFVEEHGLVGHVQAVQYALRLLLPPGSPLAGTLQWEGRLGPFDGEALTYTWSNEDPRMDALQAQVGAIVEADAANHHADAAESPVATFAKVKAAALRAKTGRDVAVTVLPQPHETVPGLTESWFC